MVLLDLVMPATMMVSMTSVFYFPSFAYSGDSYCQVRRERFSSVERLGVWRRLHGCSKISFMVGSHYICVH